MASNPNCLTHTFGTIGRGRAAELAASVFAEAAARHVDCGILCEGVVWACVRLSRVVTAGVHRGATRSYTTTLRLHVRRTTHVWGTSSLPPVAGNGGGSMVSWPTPRPGAEGRHCCLATSVDVETNSEKERKRARNRSNRRSARDEKQKNQTGRRSIKLRVSSWREKPRCVRRPGSTSDAFLAVTVLLTNWRTHTKAKRDYTAAPRRGFAVALLGGVPTAQIASDGGGSSASHCRHLLALRKMTSAETGSGANWSMRASRPWT
mmetsp:Transcript_42490/g.131207  ORF Transcript_42490/g.131207 Transcript_42490/m.131207 type:complete len:263 (-) Transcript_42490:806-1594(-)